MIIQTTLEIITREVRERGREGREEKEGRRDGEAERRKERQKWDRRKGIF